MKRLFALFLSFIMLLSFAVVPHSVYAASKLTVSCKSSVVSGNYVKATFKLGGKALSASKCILTSSKESVARVSGDGTVYAYSKGSATITAKLKSDPKVKKTFKINVTANKLSTPSLNMNFAKGSKGTLVIYYNKKRISSAAKFSTNNKAVATVSAKGVVTAKKKGSAVITVKKDKSTLHIKINVVDSKSYSIDNTTGPLNAVFTNYSSYNDNMMFYYTLRSYMEYFEKHPNSTLNIKNGVYKLTTAIYVPSKTTIKLADGVTIKSIKTTNCSTKASGSMFIFVEPSKASKSAVHSGYNGVRDVKFTASGKVVFDLSDSPSGMIGVAFVFGHNQNISISGITFTNLSYGHFMEMDASKNVTVSNCTFTNSLQGGSSPAECINLDTPDKTTGGYHQKWSSYDKTPNTSVIVKNCTFNNVQRAVGTHQYSQGKYHTAITITDCKFTNCAYGAVCAMNWKNSKIENNQFNCVGKNSKGVITNNNNTSANRALGIYGSSGITVRNNSFKNCIGCIYIGSHTNCGYETSYSSFSDEEFESMKNSNSFDEASCDVLIRMAK